MILCGWFCIDRDEVLMIVAMLSVDSVLHTPYSKVCSDIDFLSLYIYIYCYYRWKSCIQAGPLSALVLLNGFVLEICMGLVCCSRSRPVPAAVIPNPVPVLQWSIPLPSRSHSLHSPNKNENFIQMVHITR